jgi:hypothetical protein
MHKSREAIDQQHEALCECPRCLLTNDIQGVTIGATQCNFCDMHDSLNREYPISKEKEHELVNRIKIRGAAHKYDCLIGISGGADSSYLLYWAYVNNIRVLAFHFDNGFNKDLAERNMKRMIEFCGFDLIRIRLNSVEYNDLNLSFLRASVSDCDIPNDIAMGALMLDLAIKYNVKTIINGHSFRTEGSVPIGWTYMDSGYIDSVYGKYTGKMLQNYPKLTIRSQIKASLLGIKHERPYYYMDHSKAETVKFLQKTFDFETYQGRHCENKYTEFAGWIGYTKFGIDKRRIELSARIRSGEINKKTAILIMEDRVYPPDFVDEIMDALNINHIYLNDILCYPRQMYTDFDNYHKKFKKYRWLIYIGYKLHFLPKTFYVKYT